MKKTVETAYSLGQVVKHKYLDFRGVIYDVDPEFNNTEEWYKSIPAAIRPKKDQPFYHVFAENRHENSICMVFDDLDYWRLLGLYYHGSRISSHNIVATLKIKEGSGKGGGIL